MDDFGPYPMPAGTLSPNDISVSRRAAARRGSPRRPRRATVALALSRLEREHVALLLAICELESPSPETAATPHVMREALLLLLREDLRQTQHALSLAARGMYGVCEVCHRPLTARQLEQRPASTRCPTCDGPARPSAD
ncbi:MAG TPA: hypothetical protein VFU88_11110 [Ktedonobacterales bacterium]|nr:hypothetical protein [Ktedonobacterales bacterium]